MSSNINAQIKFGKRLKHLRISSGMTQTDLAERVGMSTSSIGMYEQGRREPGLDVIFNMCNIFEVHPNELLGYECGSQELEINSAMALLKEKALSCEKVTLDGKVITKSMLERLFYGYKIAEKLIVN
ncbi:MAG TPA: helix-turn-helix domain-containing protein [Firmicutes bacterium]|nr:helix-turn-helix domain-containing protein [Bacillota bacterium]